MQHTGGAETSDLRVHQSTKAMRTASSPKIHSTSSTTRQSCTTLPTQWRSFLVVGITPAHSSLTKTIVCLWSRLTTWGAINTRAPCRVLYVAISMPFFNDVENFTWGEQTGEVKIVSTKCGPRQSYHSGVLLTSGEPLQGAVDGVSSNSSRFCLRFPSIKRESHRVRGGTSPLLEVVRIDNGDKAGKSRRGKSSLLMGLKTLLLSQSNNICIQHCSQ